MLSPANSTSRQLRTLNLTIRKRRKQGSDFAIWAYPVFCANVPIRRTLSLYSGIQVRRGRNHRDVSILPTRFISELHDLGRPSPRVIDNARFIYQSRDSRHDLLPRNT